MSEDESTSQSNDAVTVFELYHEFPNPNDKIKTKDFLQTSSKLVAMIERFGKVFTPVTHDLNGNIKKLTRKYEEDPQLNEYLEEMILREQSAGESLATDALLWLKRGLNFISNLFQLIVEDNRSGRVSYDLAPLLNEAYAATLERHHGWLGVQLFNVLSRFMPNRRQFMYTLALERHDQEEVVIRDLRKYNDELKNVVMRITKFYTDYGLESTA